MQICNAAPHVITRSTLEIEYKYVLLHLTSLFEALQIFECKYVLLQLKSLLQALQKLNANVYVLLHLTSLLETLQKLNVSV